MPTLTQETPQKNHFETAPPPPLPPLPKHIKRKISPEDEVIIKGVHALQAELAHLHNQFEYATQPALVDSIIYAISAAELKYAYHMALCKERGICLSTLV